MKKLISVFLVLFALALNNMQAQKVETGEYKKSFKKALEHVENEEYRFALSIFQKLYADNPENANLEYHIGICLMDLKYEKEESIEWLKKSTKNIGSELNPGPNESKSSLKVYYLLGECYQYAGNYEEAKKWYQDFISNAEDKKFNELLVEAKKKIEWCDDMKLLLPPDIAKLEPKTKTDYSSDYFTNIEEAFQVIDLDHFKALSILNPLLEEDPYNYNLNYHIGVSCLNIKEFRHLAPKYLERACENIDLRLTKKNANAMAAPVLSHYFLGLAHCVNQNSEKGVKNYRAFLRDIGNNDPYKVPIVEQKIDECTPKMPPVDTAAIAVVSNPDTTTIAVVNVQDTAVTSQVNNKKGPKPGYYFAVQVGAGNINKTYFAQLAKLDGNNNLLQTKGKPDRMRRWIVGKFKTPEEAASLLKQVIEMGYKDAFINEFQELEIQQ